MFVRLELAGDSCFVKWCVLCLLGDADSSYTCSRCRRLFTKLRQLTSHKCAAVSDDEYDDEQSMSLADCVNKRDFDKQGCSRFHLSIFQYFCCASNLIWYS